MKTTLVAFASLLALAVRATATPYSTAVLGDSPFAYWQFEDGTLGQNVLNATAIDSVGPGPNGNHHGAYKQRGTGDGADLVAGVPGIGGLAAHFVGAGATNGDYLLTDTLGNLGSNINANGVAFEFWFQNQASPTFTVQNRLFGIYNERPGGAFKTQILMGINDPSATTTSQIFARDDAAKLQSETWNNSQKDLRDGNWHHVAWVFKPVASDGPSASAVYIDGALISLIAGTHNAQAAFSNFDKAFTIGGENQNGTAGVRAFITNGNVDEFAIYSGALTESQIQAHLAAVPEPSSALLLLVTGSLTWLVGRRAH